MQRKQQQKREQNLTWARNEDDLIEINGQR